MAALRIGGHLRDRFQRGRLWVDVEPHWARLARREVSLHDERTRLGCPVGAESRRGAVGRIVGARVWCDERLIPSAPLGVETIVRGAEGPAVADGSLRTRATTVG